MMGEGNGESGADAGVGEGSGVSVGMGVAAIGVAVATSSSTAVSSRSPVQADSRPSARATANTVSLMRNIVPSCGRKPDRRDWHGGLTLYA